jgi:hypothetical protein
MVLAEHGSFSAPISYDNFFLVVFQKPSLTFFNAVARVFKPVSGQLWASVFGICVLVGLALYIAEGDPYVQDDEGVRSVQAFWLKKRNRTWAKQVWVNTCGLSNSVYNVIFGLMSAAPRVESKTPAGKIITIGYAFFILVGGGHSQCVDSVSRITRSIANIPDS